MTRTFDELLAIGKDLSPEQLEELWAEPLDAMFHMQRSFGDHCFRKNDIRDNQGEVLTFEKIAEETRAGKHRYNNLPREWIEEFMESMEKELVEIEELLPQNHWSKDLIGEKKFPGLSPEERMNMLRIEVVDLWHFLMSMMMVCGMGPRELFDLYMKKNKVNFERQASEYNVANKTEADNLAIAKETE